MPAPKLASLFTLIVLAWASVAVPAQAAISLDSRDSDDAALLQRLSQSAGGAPLVARHSETGKARFLSMESQRPLWRSSSLAAATPEQASRAFLSIYGPLFGLRGQARELALLRQAQSAGRDFVRFQQLYEGVPVLAGEIVVQTDRDRAVVSANGEILPDPQLSVQPRMAADAAAQNGLAAITKWYGLAASDLQATAPQLWIYNPALLGGPGLRISRLVWRMEIRARGALPIRELVLVDAQTGTVALHFNQIAHAKQRFVCDGKNVIDNDTNENNNCTPAQYVRVEGQSPIGSTDVDLAYDYAGITYDYFFNNFGRDSLDGKGLPLISLVRYCSRDEQCPFENASWNGQQMTYGAGYAAADDVVGHELAHGVTEFTSGLLYYYQAGAINESLSDVFGELIDQADGRGNDSAGVRWRIGEDLPSSTGVIRNMSNPPQFGDPDRMTSSNYDGRQIDNGGVHTNSGVNNKAAFLMSDGGSFNGQTIAGLGAAKVGAIYYTLNIAFLTSGSDYQDLYEALPAACAALAASGAYGLTAADCTQVRKAVRATEMDITPTKAPAPEAPICAAGEISRDLFYDDLENPASGNWVSSAAAGKNTWYYPATPNPLDPDLVYATSGKNNFWGYDQGSNSNIPAVPADYSIAMTRDVAIPAGAHLHFRHAFELERDTTGVYDGGVVEYSDDGGGTWNDAGPLFSENGYTGVIDAMSSNPLHGRQVFSGNSRGYYSSRLDLSALAGQDVRFRFRIGTDQYVDALGWFIDDIRVYTCGVTVPVASLQTVSAMVAEESGSLAIQLNMSGVADQAISVPFAVGGTASEGADYRLSGHAFVIPAGQASGEVVVELANDRLEEPTETLTLNLGTPAGATLGNATQATVTIVDTDVTYLSYLALFSK